MEEGTMTRETGYYWVVFNGDWTIGYYDADDKDWYLFADDQPWKEEDFVEIDERKLTHPNPSHSPMKSAEEILDEVTESNPNVLSVFKDEPVISPKEAIEAMHLFANQFDEKKAFVAGWRSGNEFAFNTSFENITVNQAFEDYQIKKKGEME